jgi:WhiB family redox-sensing transcriptional regulator
MTDDDKNWRKYAICNQTDPELFFPDPWQSAAPAKLVCSFCPVRDECLTEALNNPGLQGIWAGTTPRERQQLRAQRRNQAQVA